jgi:hypothetical protein
MSKGEIETGLPGSGKWLAQFGLSLEKEFLGGHVYGGGFFRVHLLTPTIIESFRFDNMFKPLAAVAIILALLALVRGQQHQLTLLPTAPMPATLIP